MQLHVLLLTHLHRVLWRCVVYALFYTLHYFVCNHTFELALTIHLVSCLTFIFLLSPPHSSLHVRVIHPVCCHYRCSRYTTTNISTATQSLDTSSYESLFICVTHPFASTTCPFARTTHPFARITHPFTYTTRPFSVPLPRPQTSARAQHAALLLLCRKVHPASHINPKP